MIISEFQTFLIMILDNVKACLVVLSFLSFFTFLAFVFFSKESSTTKEEEWFIKWAKKIAIICSIFAILATIVPSTKQMLATLIIPKIVNNEQIQNLSADTIKAIGLLVNGEQNERADKKTNK